MKPSRALAVRLRMSRWMTNDYIFDSENKRPTNNVLFYSLRGRPPSVPEEMVLEIPSMFELVEFCEARWDSSHALQQLSIISTSSIVRPPWRSCPCNNSRSVGDQDADREALGSRLRHSAIDIRSFTGGALAMSFLAVISDFCISPTDRWQGSSY